MAATHLVAFPRGAVLSPVPFAAGWPEALGAFEDVRSACAPDGAVLACVFACDPRRTGESVLSPAVPRVGISGGRMSVLVAWASLALCWAYSRVRWNLAAAWVCIVALASIGLARRFGKPACPGGLDGHGKRPRHAAHHTPARPMGGRKVVLHLSVALAGRRGCRVSAFGRISDQEVNGPNACHLVGYAQPSCDRIPSAAASFDAACACAVGNPWSAAGAERFGIDLARVPGTGASRG